MGKKFQAKQEVELAKGKHVLTNFNFENRKNKASWKLSQAPGG